MDSKRLGVSVLYICCIYYLLVVRKFTWGINVAIATLLRNMWLYGAVLVNFVALGGYCNNIEDNLRPMLAKVFTFYHCLYF